MADLARIKGNVGKMVQQNAPEADIDAYIASEGVTLDALRSFKGTPERGPSFMDEYNGASKAKTPQPGDDLSPLAQKVGAFVSAGTDSVPIAGPFLTDAMHSLFAKTQADRLGKGDDEVRANTERLTGRLVEENPKTAMAGSITGATAGTLPAIMMAPEAFGGGSASLGTRSLISALSGAGIGGTDAAVRSGGDMDATGKGALMGLVAGGLGPAVGKGIGAAAQTVGDSLLTSRLAQALGLDKKAFSLMASGAERDGLDAATARARLDELGPDSMVMDLGPNLRRQAAGLASMPGEGQKIVRGAVEARDVGANRRIIDALDDTLGPAPVPRQVDAALEASQRDLSPHYREVFQNAQPVNTAPIARYLDREISTLRGEAQRGVTRIREMLNRVGTEELEPNPVVLLETRKAVDGMIETVQDSNARNALQTARQAIDDELRRSVPGIKEADAKFAELARQREGLQRGQTVLSSGRESPRPVELAEEFQRGALPQGEMVGPSAVSLRLQQGARAELERIIGTTANDRVALQRAIKGDGSWNRARLETLFGREKADRIINLVDAEKLFADTSHIVTRNSETAARQAAQAELEGGAGQNFGMREAYMAGGSMGVARTAGLKGADKVINALQGLKSERARGQIANTLTGRDLAVVEALAQRVAGANVPKEQINAIARALLLGPATASR